MIEPTLAQITIPVVVFEATIISILVMEAIWAVTVSFFHLPKLLIRRLLELRPKLDTSVLGLVWFLPALAVSFWLPHLGLAMLGFAIAKRIAPFVMMYFTLWFLFSREPLGVIRKLRKDVLLPTAVQSLVIEHAFLQHHFPFEIRPIIGDSYTLLYVDNHSMLYVLLGEVTPGPLRPVSIGEREAVYTALRDVCQHHGLINA